MAKKDRITLKETLEPGIIKGFSGLNTQLDKSVALMAALAKNASDFQKSIPKKDVDALAESQKKYNKERAKGTKASKEAISAEEKIRKKIQAVSVAEEKAKLALQEKRKAIRDNIKAQKQQEQAIGNLVKELRTEVKTEAQATEQNKRLLKIRKQLDASTEKGAKKVSLINKQIDKNNNLLNNQASAYGKQKRNIGNYGSALDALPGRFGAMAQGAKGAAGALKALAGVPIVLVIIAIVGAIKGLVDLFKSTDAGATQLEATMNGLKAAFQVVKGAILDIIEGTKARFQLFIKSWELLKAKIKGNDEEVAKVKEQMRQLANEINNNKPFENLGSRAAEAYRAVHELTFQMDALNDRMISAISEQKQLELEMERYIKLSKDQTLSDAERVDFLENGMQKAKELFGMRKDFAQQELDNEIAKLAAEREVTEEQVRWLIEAGNEEVEHARKTNEEIGELWNEGGDDRIQMLEEMYVKVIEADVQYEKKTKELTSLLSGMQKKMYKEQADAAEDAKLAKIRAAQEAADAELTQLQRVQTTAAEQRVEAQELELADMSDHFEQTRKLALEHEDELNEARKEKRRQWTQFAVNQASQLASSIFGYQRQELQVEQQMAIEKAKARGASEEEIAKIEKKYAKERRDQAVKEAIINGALAVVNALTVQPFWVGLVLAGVAAATTAIQVATIKAQKFAKGTKDSGTQGQVAWVGDGGEPELITHQDGSQYWSPDSDTLTYLPPHSKVEPLHALKRDAEDMSAISKRTKLPQPDKQAERRHNEMMSALNKKDETYINVTKKGFEITARKGNTRINYITRKYRN